MRVKDRHRDELRASESLLLVRVKYKSRRFWAKGVMEVNYKVESDRDGMYPVVKVIYNDEKVFEWWDGAHMEQPEDLTWGRSIGQVFREGVELGKRMAEDEEGGDMLRLQKEREERGWNRTELSRKAKISLSNYSPLENGKRKPFEPEKHRLAEVLEVPEDELFKWVN